MNLNSTYLFLIILAFCACGKKVDLPKSNESIVYKVNKKESKAGDQVILNFEGTDSTSWLYYSSSYGNSVLTPRIFDHHISFIIPDFITNKIGVINWKLIQGGKTKKEGQVNILTSTSVDKVETYFGPTFLYAGPENFSHLVSIPIDSLDNPIQSNTEVKINEQFKTSIRSSSVYTDNLIAFKPIYSQRLTGRLLLNSECKGTSSKELSATISSALPLNFSIQIELNHSYSDGNQISVISSSIIKDQYGNVINDGTLVKFIIKNQKGNLLHTTANTINGVASAQMIHPVESDHWEIQAVILGMAESNTITADFKSSIKDYQVNFSNKNRTINIGPIKGFMNQLVPDGVIIQLSVFKEGKLIKKLHQESCEGFSNFSLTNSVFESGTYTLEFDVAGIKKSFKNIVI